MKHEKLWTDSNTFELKKRRHFYLLFEAMKRNTNNAKFSF